MALNTITPSNREEEYLSAIAGDAGASAPVPSNRREEWLRRIAEGQDDQTDRLDHIEDQIPVDPTAEDVGKVMTVVADESGEEPVYKWEAAEASSGDRKQLVHQYINQALQGQKSNFFTISKTDSAIAEYWPLITAELRNARGNLDYYTILDKYIEVYAYGHRLLPLLSTAPIETSTSITLSAYFPIVSTSGSFWAYFTCVIDTEDNTSGNAVAFSYTIYQANGSTPIATSDLGTTKNTICLVSIKY